METIIAINYSNPYHPASFGSLENTLRFYRSHADAEIVRKALRRIDAYTKKRVQRRIKTYIPIYVYFKRELFQIDLVEVQYMKNENDGVRYLLSVIDSTTRMGWMLPLRSKKGPEVAEVFNKFISSLKIKPQKILSDRGTEFTCKAFQSVLKEWSIKHILPKTSNHAPTVERFNRSMQSLLYKYLASRKDNAYLNFLPKLLQRYNNRLHRTLGMSPSAAELPKNKKKLLRALMKYYSKAFTVGRKKQKRSRVLVGDKVIIAVERGQFHKGYKDQYKNEIFKVHSIDISKHIPLFRLISLDAKREILEGGFYEEEIQVVGDQNSRPLPPHKIIRKRKSSSDDDIELFIRWKGFPKKYGGWTPKRLLSF